MVRWSEVIHRVDALEDLPVEDALVQEMQAHWLSRSQDASPTIHFYTPTFKSYQTSELSCASRSAWPALSVTGAECRLKCDHCRAKVLEPMLPARTPDELWRTVNELVADGARGMLLTGGSNVRNEVEYGPLYPTIRRIKDSFPGFRIATHTALVDRRTAMIMEEAGIDVAMMDVIGSQETITQVYHLKRGVADFEATLEALVATSMKVVPHIVIGLHYGRLLGEWNALEIVRRHLPSALVLVVIMPFYASARRPFATPEAVDVGRFFLEARRALAGLPLLLGCARPAGVSKVQIDTYAALAGLNGIAHPSDGIVELAARLGRRVRVTPACCSVAVGEEVFALDDPASGTELDLATLLERRNRASEVPVTFHPRRGNASSRQ